MHNRKSIRFPDYDYSLSGEYFITICVKDRLCLLGEIINGEVVLSDNGRIVHEWINRLTARFPVKLEHFVIMPNHLHLIIEIQNYFDDAEAETMLSSETDFRMKDKDFERWRIGRKNMLLPKVINYLKSNSAREINKKNDTSEQSFWQRNYFERIIRNQKEYENIVEYIMNNPSNWENDEENIFT